MRRLAEGRSLLLPPPPLLLLLLLASNSAQWSSSVAAAAAAAGPPHRITYASSDETDRWRERSDVEVVDFKDTDVQARLKARGLGAPPLVIKGALTKTANKKFGSLAELAKFGKASVVRKLLKDGGGGMTGAKLNKHSPHFQYWDNSIQWLGKTEMRDHKKRHAWHRWKYDDTISIDRFFRAFPKNTTPHLYWQNVIPPDVIGVNPRPALCKRAASSEFERACSEEETAGTMWLNSAGQIAHAHFDREAIIFVQLSGTKRWTFFHPTQLSELCLYPYAHPALRSLQVRRVVWVVSTGADQMVDRTDSWCPSLQADLGNNVGSANCVRSRGLHNRSIVLSPGDLLIVGPYHVVSLPAAAQRGGNCCDI